MAPLLGAGLDANDGIGTADSQETFLGFLEHLDVYLITRRYSQLCQRGLNGYVNGRSSDFNPLHGHFLLRRLRFLAETGCETGFGGGSTESSGSGSRGAGVGRPSILKINACWPIRKKLAVMK